MTCTLSELSPAELDQLADGIVDYCLATYGQREGAIRALAAVGVGAQQCTNALPHRVHLDDGCPGLSLAEYIADGGELPRCAELDPAEGPDYDETAETAEECRRDLTEAEQ